MISKKKKNRKKKKGIITTVDDKDKDKVTISRYFTSSLEKQVLYQEIIKQFIEWPTWQKRLILCRFTERTSCSLLSTLCTALEPIFHRDFEINSKLGFHSTLLKTYAHSKTIDSSTKDQSVPKEPNNLSLSSNSNEIDNHYGKSINSSPTFSLDSGNKYDHVTNNEKSVHTPLVSTANCMKNISKVSEKLGEKSSCPSPPINDELCAANVNFTFLNKNQQGISHNHLSKRNSGSLATMEFLKHSQKENTKRLGGLVKPITRDKNRLCHVGEFKHEKWWHQPHPSYKNNLRKASKRSFLKSFRTITDDFVHKYASWSNAEKGDFILNIVDNCSTDEVMFFANCISQRLEKVDNINILNDQTLLRIFFLLDCDNLRLAGQVCQKWKHLTSSACIWQKKCCQFAQKYDQLDVIRNLESATTVELDWKQLYREFKQSMSILEHHSSERADLNTHAPSISPHLTVTDEDDNNSKVIKRHKGIDHTEDFTDVKDDKESLSRISDSHLPNSITDEAFECHDFRDDVIHNLASMTLEESNTTLDPNTLEPVESKVKDVYITESEMVHTKKVVPLKEEKNVEESEGVAFDVRVRLVQAENQINPNIVKMSTDDPEYILERDDSEHDPEHDNYRRAVVSNIKTVNRVMKLEGHREAVLCLQFDSKRVMTGSSDRSIKLWDIRTGRFFRALEGHQGGVRCLKFDEKYIVSGSWDTTVRIWDVVDFTNITVLTEHSDCVSCVEFTEDALITASHDNTICIFKKHTWKLLVKLQKHTAPVSCLTLLPIDSSMLLPDNQLLSGSHDKTLLLWDLDTHCVLREFHGLKYPCLCVKVCGDLVAAGASDGTITFWNLSNSQIEGRILAHNDSVTALCFVEARFFSAGRDGVIREWDLSTCTCLRTLRGHGGPVLCLRASSKRVVSGSTDGTARIWDMTHKLQQVGGKYDELNTGIIQAQVLNEEQFKEQTISKVLNCLGEKISF